MADATNKRTPELAALATDWGTIAFLVAVAAAYLITFLPNLEAFSFLQVTIMLGLGIPYVFMGTYYWDTQVEQRDSYLLLWVYFGVQLLLGGIIVYLGQSAPWVLLLPLVSQAVFVLPRQGYLTVAAIVLLLEILPMILEANYLGASLYGFAFFAAVVFVMVFSQLAVSEQRARSELEKLTDQLRTANQKLREYAAHAEDLAIAEERNRLAREIHDGLGHYLTAVHMQIQAAQAVLDQDPRKANDALSKAQTLSREALADVRRSVASLRALPVEDRPLVSALDALAEDCRSEGIDIRIAINGDPRPLPPQVSLALYRAAQEGLTNVRKHARARSVSLVVDFSELERVVLGVQDDGVGVNPGNSEGYGLLGLRERARLLGGDLQVVSAPGKGFSLVMELPVPAQTWATDSQDGIASEEGSFT